MPVFKLPKQQTWMFVLGVAVLLFVVLLVKRSFDVEGFQTSNLSCPTGYTLKTNTIGGDVYGSCISTATSITWAGGGGNSSATFSGVPDSCKGLGTIQMTGGLANFPVYTNAECNLLNNTTNASNTVDVTMLDGTTMGQCNKTSGGTFSWDCRSIASTFLSGDVTKPVLVSPTCATGYTAVGAGTSKKCVSNSASSTAVSSSDPNYTCPSGYTVVSATVDGVVKRKCQSTSNTIAWPGGSGNAAATITGQSGGPAVPAICKGLGTVQTSGSMNGFPVYTPAECRALDPNGSITNDVQLPDGTWLGQCGSNLINSTFSWVCRGLAATSSTSPTDSTKNATLPACGQNSQLNSTKTACVCNSNNITNWGTAADPVCSQCPPGYTAVTNPSSYSFNGTACLKCTNSATQSKTLLTNLDFGMKGLCGVCGLGETPTISKSNGCSGSSNLSFEAAEQPVCMNAPNRSEWIPGSNPSTSNTGASTIYKCSSSSSSYGTERAPPPNGCIVLKNKDGYAGNLSPGGADAMIPNATTSLWSGFFSPYLGFGSLKNSKSLLWIDWPKYPENDPDHMYGYNFRNFFQYVDYSTPIPAPGALAAGSVPVGGRCTIHADCQTVFGTSPNTYNKAVYCINNKCQEKIVCKTDNTTRNYGWNF
jgi:hypothetical protein